MNSVAVDQLKAGANDEIRRLVDEGKRKGVLTYEEINDTLSHQEDLDAEQVDDILQTFADEGIRVVEKSKELGAPLPEGLGGTDQGLAEAEVPEEDLAAVEGFPLDDSVRMWLREIG